MQLQDDYFAAYRSLKLTRDADGVLVVEFHTKGRPFTFTAQDHTEFVDAFYRIAQDREIKIVILTGAGGEFIPEIDFSSFGNVADPGVWSQVHDEGVRPSTMSRTSREALCRATESLPRGVIALERDEQRRSCSIHSRSRRKPRTNGE
jgi:enoyl-CoA hydratase/carnithine racemase